MRKLNWKPDPTDERDFRLAMPLLLDAHPEQVDLRALCSPVVDQGQQGSCTANAGVSGAFEFLELRELKNKGAAPTEFDPKSFIRGSRQFNYYVTRAQHGWQGVDSGAYLRDVVKALSQVGCCRESSWPYDPRNLAVQPSSPSYVEASKHRVTSYIRLNGVGELKQSLADGFPFIFGFNVYSAFQKIDSSGVLRLPSPGEKPVGGHAVCGVGYDDAKEHFIIRNSYGEHWGDKGYFYMPYTFILNEGSDFWTIRK